MRPKNLRTRPTPEVAGCEAAILREAKDGFLLEFLGIFRLSGHASPRVEGRRVTSTLNDTHNGQLPAGCNHPSGWGRCSTVPRRKGASLQNGQVLLTTVLLFLFHCPVVSISSAIEAVEFLH